MTETEQAIMERPITTIEKVVEDGTVTYIEKKKWQKEEAAPLNPELKQLIEREAPELPTVVVRCNRNTGQWQLFKNNKAYKNLTAAVLINVSFSCEWKEGKSYGCGNNVDGEYMGYASGNLLPIATPVTVPEKGVVRLRFDPDDGKFYNPETGEKLSGSGYLILKPGCSSEYVNASAIGVEKGETKTKKGRKNGSKNNS